MKIELADPAESGGEAVLVDGGHQRFVRIDLLPVPRRRFEVIVDLLLAGYAIVLHMHGGAIEVPLQNIYDDGSNPIHRAFAASGMDYRRRRSGLSDLRRPRSCAVPGEWGNCAGPGGAAGLVS